MPISRGEALRARTTLILALLSKATKAMIARPNLAPLIIGHSVLMHQITRASVPLMEAALLESEKRTDDPVCRELAPYLKGHIQEEMHHDEWTLQDLESIGISRAIVLASIPAGNVAALVGAQYYWILHHHPVAILGYMVALEAHAPPEAAINDLQAKTGLPEGFFRSYQIHAALDPHHEAELFHLIDTLPLEPAHEQLITESLWHSGKMLADTLANPQLWDRSGVVNSFLHNQ
jgi:hypothetical protein